MTDRGAFISPTRNRWLGYALTGMAAAMLGLAFAAVPLYSLFCQVTGFAGTTQRAEAAPLGTIARQMTVSFDANVNSALPWKVVPAGSVEGPIGGVQQAVFTATNLSDRTTTGQAVFNVTPLRAGAYFNKIQCFCFTRQTLGPGETVEMPVIFFVDPTIDENDDLHTVNDITLSYTFYAEDEKGS